MNPNEVSHEEYVKAKGLDKAPRITPNDLEAEIAGEEYQVFSGSTLTVCVLTLRNGFTVVGESACASPENFDKALGEKIARQKAKDKLWPLLGFRLRDRIVSGWFDAGQTKGD